MIIITSCSSFVILDNEVRCLLFHRINLNQSKKLIFEILILSHVLEVVLIRVWHTLTLELGLLIWLLDWV